VIQPEVRHHGFDLALAVDITFQPRLQELGPDHPLRPAERGEDLLLLRAEIAGDGGELRLTEAPAEVHQLFRLEREDPPNAGVWRKSQDLGGRRLREGSFVVPGPATIPGRLRHTLLRRGSALGLSRGSALGLSRGSALGIHDRGSRRLLLAGHGVGRRLAAEQVDSNAAPSPLLRGPIQREGVRSLHLRSRAGHPCGLTRVSQSLLSSGFARLGFLIEGDAVGIDGVLDRVSRQRFIPLDHRLQPLRIGIPVHQLLLRERHSGERSQADI